MLYDGGMQKDTWHPRTPSNDDAPAFAIPYASNFDPPPGEDGYFLNFGRDRGYNIFPDRVDNETMEKWRRIIVEEIRGIMKRLDAPRGTNFHQLIRINDGLPVTEEPAEPRDPEEEDARLIAEFEWELRFCRLAYPSGATDVLRVHYGNSQEKWASWSSQ